MDKLTIEEKAKAYDFSLKRAKRLYEQGTITESLSYVFPQLKKLGDGEVRKEIMQLIQGMHDADPRKERWLAWLEKQGEPKPQGKTALEAIKEEKVDNANKVEPKFKVGDWVVWDNKISCHIDKIYQGKESLMYTITDAHNMTRSYDVKGFDNNAHLWSIQDAKDGDVLEFGDHGRLVVGIVSYINKSTGKVDVYCLLEANNFKVGIYYALDTIKPHPAPKERCDLLFSKMKEASYEWDAEKKELKRIEDETEIPFGAKDSELQEATYYIPQGFHAEIDDDKVVIKKGEKPITWSEEDKKMSRFIGNAITADDSSVYLKNKGIEVIDAHVWLDELKDRVQPQPKQEWSEGDENYHRICLDLCTGMPNGGGYAPYIKDEAIDWLKSLRQRIGG